MADKLTTCEALTDEAVSEIVRRILSVAGPERIIIFGSAASNQMTSDSDVDLLILLDDAGEARETSVLVRNTLRGLGMPFDVLVMSVNWFEATKDLVGGLAYPAHHSGKVIYARR